MSLEDNLKLSSKQLSQNLAQSEKHFHSLLQTQSQLAMLIVEEANIRANLINIQASLTPHMEILHKELGFVETLLKKYPNISTIDWLVHLGEEIAIQIKSLEVACDNYDATLKIKMGVQKTFLENYTISL